MSEPVLVDLLDRAGAATPVSAPPIGRIVAGARSRRRRRLAGAIGLTVATVAVVGLGAVNLGSPQDAGQPAAPPGSTDRGGLPSDAELAGYVTELETTVLPVLDELQIAYFMDESDCAILTYARSPGGDFADGDPEDCGGSTGKPAPFDDDVRADHARLAAALAESGTPIERVSATFGSGDLRGGFFSSSHGAPFSTTWELVYDPDDPGLKTPSGQITLVIPVPDKDGWWFSCCAD